MDTPTQKEAMRTASRLPRVVILIVFLMVLGAIATGVLLTRYYDLNSG